MAITYGFFNSSSGDRKYNADQMSQYFKGLISNGVFESVGGALQVIAGTGMTVQVKTGRAIIDCKWIDNDAVLNLDITQAHGALNRWTAVVVKLDITNRLMTITTKDGTPASTPTQPSMDNTSTSVEICLAMIYVAAGVTSISQADITDMRPSSKCGWITGLINQVDTSELFIQYQTAYENYYETMTEEFEQWFDTLTDQLNVNTYIRRFKKTVTLDGTESGEIELNMTNYEYDAADIIYVYINGLFGVENSDWTLDTTGATPTVTVNATNAGNVISVEILKSKIGFNTVLASDNSILGDPSNNSVVIVGEG